MVTVLEKYQEIIHLPHHESLVHKRMSLEERAYQFGSFAALNGFKEQIKDTERVVDKKPRLSSDELDALDYKFKWLIQNLYQKPSIWLTYFVKDKDKNGGYILNRKVTVFKINMEKKKLITTKKEEIPLKNILDITLSTEDFKSL